MSDRPAIFLSNPGVLGLFFLIFCFRIFVEPEESVVEEAPESDGGFCVAQAATRESGQVAVRLHVAEASFDARGTLFVKLL